MEISAADDTTDLAISAADLIEQTIVEKPDAVILAATGDTPMDCYAELARRPIDASRLRVAQLDEYVGIGEDDPRSLYGWMRRSLCDPLGVDETRIVRLAPNDDPAAACRAYDAEIRAAGGVDLAILGLGPNGHLGFNEPPTDADAPTREVALTPASLQSNARYWPEVSVPERAVTAGMALILAARRVLLLVSGGRKVDILRRMMAAEPNRWLPASWLHLHPDAVVLADRAALGDSAQP